MSKQAAAPVDPLLSPLLQRLYEDAVAGQGLTGALVATAQLFDATVAHLVASDPSSQVPLWAQSADTHGGEMLGASMRYDAELFRSDPRRVPGMARLARQGAWRCQEFLAEGDVSRSAFFQDFFLPIGLRHSMVARLPTSSAPSPAGVEMVDLAIVRGPDQTGFELDALARLRGLVPHVHTALSLQRMHEALQAGTAALGAAATDAVVLDDRSGIAAATPGAVAQVGSVFGRLVFGRGAHRRGQPQVDAALSATRADGLPRHVGLGAAQGLGERLWITISRRVRAGHATGVTLGADRAERADQGYELLLLLRWPDRRHTVPPELLQQMLGLTRREAEIGCALLEGLSPRDMWTRRGLSPATVRSQLRSLYAKTGTSGQVEFVRLVAQLTQGLEP